MKGLVVRCATCAVAALLAAGAGGCLPEDVLSHDLTIHCSNMTTNRPDAFAVMDEQPLTIWVVEDAAEGASIVEKRVISEYPQDEFDIVFENVLDKGRVYQVRFYVDQDGNGVYDEINTFEPQYGDFAWQRTISDVEGDVEIYWQVFQWSMQPIELPE
ncbi:MAG: hypothetical protein GF418_01315 [Chitinivibrionales bacterium]|nr:hypothetical protein [Chitinivibrionales bacterium]MBD3394241.1 hypothetical protein [Chitinivibrionales bacterium]